MSIIGIIASIAVMVAALYSSQFVLLSFSTGFLLICLSSFVLAKLKYRIFATHILLDGFIIGFTLSPFFGLYYLSTILIYPLVISLAIFFINDPLKRFAYAFISVVACIIVISQLKLNFYNISEYHILEEGLIVIGLLAALFIVGFNYFVVLFRYQGKLEESEQLMHNKNIELENYIDSNLQLENFAHLASHELKTPLRNILNFSKLLAKKLDGTMSSQEKEMLGIIEQQASEMDELIRDLFELSSVSNEPMRTNKLKLELMLQDLIKFDFFENRSNIKVAGVPKEILGNKSYIKEVFKNLISNALKFVSTDKEVEIIIDYEERQKEYQFSVTDNGIGINENKRDKVFLIFKRLHTRKDYEGTGIGLAICKKIVERHLGRIWIEDNPQGGTIFKFTIAKNLV